MIDEFDFPKITLNYTRNIASDRFAKKIGTNANVTHPNSHTYNVHSRAKCQRQKFLFVYIPCAQCALFSENGIDEVESNDTEK